MLILLSLEINEKKLENLIKLKIRNSDINDDLLHKTFRSHHSILQDYAQQLLSLSESLLRTVDPVISLFGSSIYIESFIWFDSFYKQEVISNLLIHISNKSVTEANMALNTLVNLVRSHSQKVATFSLFIKSLLDQLHNLTLNQIRKVYEILCLLAYQGGREGSMLLDDLLIIVRKQLTNKNLRYRKMGIIGSLMAAKISAEKENSSPETNVSVSSYVLDTQVCYQHSIKLLELAAESTAESCEAFALFCDELSQILLQKNLSKTILDWIGEKILSEFEETFIVDLKPNEYDGKVASPKFALDEVHEPVGLNLYNLVLCDKKKSKFKKADGKENILMTLDKLPNNANPNEPGSSSECNSEVGFFLSSPLLLAPSFRLLRIFRQIQDNNLDSIDALLGCSIILPEFKSLKLSSLSLFEQHVIMDTLFYCINWIRENLNAFVTTEDEDIKCNVFCRLQLLVEMEEFLCSYIKDVESYTPPIANFDCEEQYGSFKLLVKKPIKRSVKCKKSKSKKIKTADSEQMTQNESINSKSDSDADEEFEPKLAQSGSVVKLLQPYFRELDLDVFILLNSGVNFHKPPDVFNNEKRTEIILHSKELKFLLQDLDAKLYYSLHSSTGYFKQIQKKSGFSNLDLQTPLKIVSFCTNLLPSLCHLAEECVAFFKTLSEDCETAEKSLIFFTNDSQCIMQCLNFIFKIISQVISWKDLNLNENATLLRKLVESIALRLNKSIQEASLNELISTAIDYFHLFTDAVPSLVCAANFIHLISSLLLYASNNESKTKCSTMALTFLKKSWLDFNNKAGKTSENNENIKIILEAYIKNSNSVLESLEYLATEAIPQVMNTVENITFNTLNKSSLACYYKIMFFSFSDFTKIHFNGTGISDLKKMHDWSVAFKIFQVLTNLIKTHGSRLYIGTCLKYSREFLNTFLKHGMPLMDKLFSTNREEIICLMKILQVSTRYLQHVCSHSKVAKDVTLIKHVPFLKKNLEVFVFRVKMMLAVNKCEDAFWLGNLKNRDIKGAEICSQGAEPSDDNSENENSGLEDINNSETEDLALIDTEAED